jgi:hypothetical protein
LKFHVYGGVIAATDPESVEDTGFESSAGVLKILEALRDDLLLDLLCGARRLRVPLHLEDASGTPSHGRHRLVDETVHEGADKALWGSLLAACTLSGELHGVSLLPRQWPR